jgi:hypothetical protein
MLHRETLLGPEKMVMIILASHFGKKWTLRARFNMAYRVTVAVP